MFKEELLERLNEEGALVATGLDDALIGIGHVWVEQGEGEGCVRRYLAVYSEQKCIEILMERDGMAEDEAQEFFDTNVVGAYVGVGTPIFVDIVEEPKEWPDPDFND